MATVVMSAGSLQRPTISSAARSSSIAVANVATLQRQSAVAARLAAGNHPNGSRRSSGAPPPPANNNNNIISAASSVSSASKSVLPPAPNNNRQPAPTQIAKPNHAGLLKIPSLSTALLQSAPKQVAQNSSSRPVSTLMASTAILGTGAAHTVGSPPNSAKARQSSTHINNNNNNNNQPAPPPLPSSSSPPPQPQVPSSSHHRTSTTRVAPFATTSSNNATTVTPRMAVPTNTPRQTGSNFHRQPSTRTVSLPHNTNNPVKVDEEPVTAVQLIKPTSKETTLGVETNDVETVAVAVQCEEILHENASVNTSLSFFNQRDSQAQTRTTGSDLELACNQMESRFLAMSVVAQDFAEKLARSQGRTRQLIEENKNNEAKLREEFHLEISKILTEHATASAVSKQKYEQVLVKLEESFRAKVLETEEHLASEHVQQLRDLETEWSGRLMAANDDFIAKLQAQRQEAEKRERELASLVTTEDEAVSKRVEAETVRFKAAFAENDSLRAVLDLRSAELRQLRAENAQLRVNIEEMPDYRERINQLEHQIENLEAVLSTKRDQEKTLNERQRELLQRVEDIEAEKRQIWRACEVLVYKLQSAGMLPLSNNNNATSVQQSPCSPTKVDSLNLTGVAEPTSPSPTSNKNGHRQVGPPFTSSTPLVPNGCKARFLIANDEDFGATHTLNSTNSSLVDADRSSSPQIIEAATPCSPETESILQKIIESSSSSQLKVEVAVSCSDIAGSSKASSQGVYSASSDSASPRSVSSSNTSASPPPQIIDPLQLSASNSSTSGCYSSNEMMMDELKTFGFAD